MTLIYLETTTAEYSRVDPGVIRYYRRDLGSEQRFLKLLPVRYLAPVIAQVRGALFLRAQMQAAQREDRYRGPTAAACFIPD